MGSASPPTPASISRPAPPTRTLRRVVTAVVVAGIVLAALDLGLSPADLVMAPSRLARFARLMFLPPDIAYTGRALDGMVQSIQMAWIGTLIAAIGSLPLGLVGARNVTGGPVGAAVRLVLNGFRAVPELVLAIVLITIVGLGAFPGAVAIGIHSIGTLGKLTAEAVESIAPGPVEAARAAGAGRAGVYRWGVLPQVAPEIVAFWLYRFEINVRASAVLGLVGAGGVGAVLQNTLTFRRWDKAGMTILVVIVATVVIDALSSAARRRIIGGGTPGMVVSEEVKA